MRWNKLPIILAGALLACIALRQIDAHDAAANGGGQQPVATLPEGAIASASSSPVAHSSMGKQSSKADDTLAPGVPLMFEPEDDWKEILPGQQIPAGLDIRMDLGKGGKWAKKPAGWGERRGRGVASLPSKAPEAVATSAVVIAPDTGAVLAATEAEGLAGVASDAAAPQADDPPAEPTIHGMSLPEGFPADLDERSTRMADILLGLPEPEPELESLLKSGQAASMDRAQLQELLQNVWNKRQLQLKEAFAKAKTEAQQMQALLKRLVDPSSGSDIGADGTGVQPAMTAQEQVTVLEDLEFFVTTVHNAEDFAGMGGLTAMALLTNSSDPRVASSAAWVIGTAVKNAPTVQAVALEQGAMPALLGLLRSSVRDINRGLYGAPGSAVSVTDVTGVTAGLRTASKGVYALGGLLRYCPDGQSQFVAGQGQVALAEALQVASVVSKGWTESAIESQRVAARQADSTAGKILTLLADLLQHHEASGARHQTVWKRVKSGMPPTNETTAAVADTTGSDAAAGARTEDRHVPLTLLAKDGSTGGPQAVHLDGQQDDSSTAGTSAMKTLKQDPAGFSVLCQAAELAVQAVTRHGSVAAEDPAAAEVASQAATAAPAIASACKVQPSA